jgi:hypothetical protein
LSKNRAFDTIINLINEELKVLNNAGYKIYDGTNPVWYVAGYHYNQKEDKILVDFEEEEA